MSSNRTGPVRIGVDMHTVTAIHQGVRSHLLNIYAEAVVLYPDIEFVFLGAPREALVQYSQNYAVSNVTCTGGLGSHSIQRLLYQHSLLQKKHRLDIVHYQYICPLVNFCPVAVTVHDVLFETHPQYFSRFFRLRSRTFVRRSADKAEALFTVSDYSRQQLVKRYGLDPAAIHLTPNAVDHERFYPARTSDEDSGPLARRSLLPRGYILSVGRLEPRKNHVTLLRAFAALPQAPPLVIVGQQDFGFHEIYQLIDELHIGDRVRLLHDVSASELPALYRHALLFAYPSFAEGFGMPLLEAFASGTPVVCSDTTALLEVAAGAARLADPHSAPSLTSALADVLQQPELRASMIANGLAVSRQYTWRASAESLMRGLLAAV